MQRSHKYDLFDRRISRAVDTTSPFDLQDAAIDRYVYDDANGITSDDGGNVLFDFVDDDGPSGPNSAALSSRQLFGKAVDQIFAQEDVTETITSANRVSWQLVDNAGTTRDIAKNDTSIATHLQYDAFGGITSGDRSLTRYLYTGREFDAATKLQYNRARWFDSNVGRWISEDPIGFAAGDTNLSRYVSNAPVLRNDPSGFYDIFPNSHEGTFEYTPPEIPLQPGDLHVTIYVDQPTVDGRVRRGFGRYGHVWITVEGITEEGNQESTTVGFWPENGPFEGPGVIVDDSRRMESRETQPSVGVSIFVPGNVDIPSYEEVLERIDEANGTPWGHAHNCSDFACEIVEFSGIDLPVDIGRTSNGNRYPGPLGVDLKEFELPPYVEGERPTGPVITGRGSGTDPGKIDGASSAAAKWSRNNHGGGIRGW